MKTRIVVCGVINIINNFKYMNYTDEQKADIIERVNKAMEFLKEIELSPAAAISKVALGNDVFADRVQAYLKDTKYEEKPEVKEEETVKGAVTE